jgi:hypothetical protein
MMKVFLLLLLNILCTFALIYLLVHRTSVSRGRQKERGTPVVNPQVSMPSLHQHDQGIIIELLIFPVLIYIRYFDG